MVVEIDGLDATDAYYEALHKIKVFGEVQQTRNGRALVIPESVHLTILRPWRRVVFCPYRDANPFFHVAEFIWMMTGSREADYPASFVKQIAEYADVDGTINGAYGWRWQHGVNQIVEVVRKLRNDSTTRQAVISMWDPLLDNVPSKRDYPCNTHIYFTIRNNKVNMTVCNRSNDIIWGMLGANVVHMTLLHQLVAEAVCKEMGTYTVFTVNAHIYEPHWPLLDDIGAYNPYRSMDTEKPLRMLGPGEDVEQFQEHCRNYINSGKTPQDIESPWLARFAIPYVEWYSYRKGGVHMPLPAVPLADFMLAAQEWKERRNSIAGTLA